MPELKTLDDTTQASNPGWLRVSPRKLHALHPELASAWAWVAHCIRERTTRGLSRAFWRTHIEEHLMHGDSRAAIVVSIAPLRVAAYSDDLDCIVLLKFEQAFVRDYGLKVGARLLTVNTYSPINCGYASDIVPGEVHSKDWGNFAPYIGEFLSDDVLSIEQRKATIAEDEWLRTTMLAQQYRKARGLAARDGRPMHCAKPAF